MRVISGWLKSRKLIFPRTHLTRPVTDRSKETIFNILGDRIEGADALDLFAGSGSFGIEALSRGAKTALFVDHASICHECIHRNLKTLGILNQGQILKMEAEQAIQKLEITSKSFDLIFLDPPHNKGFIKKVLQLLDGSDIVRPGSIIVVGHSNKEGLPETFNTLRLERTVQIGQAFVSFIYRPTDESAK